MTQTNYPDFSFIYKIFLTFPPYKKIEYINYFRSQNLNIFFQLFSPLEYFFIRCHKT